MSAHAGGGRASREHSARRPQTHPAARTFQVQTMMMDERPARNTDPQTSWDAIPDDLPERRRQVYQAILAASENGANWREVSEYLSSVMPPQSISPRFRELVDQDLIEDSGLRRPGWGKPQIVWVAKRRSPPQDENGQCLFVLG